LGRIGFQKLAYFAEQAGIDTGLNWERGSFGPFSKGGKRMLASLVNNGLVTERRTGRMFNVQVGSTFDDAAVAFSAELESSKEAITRVADLFRRLRTRQSEVAATVHYAARELAEQAGGPPTEAEVLDEVMRWKARRNPPFSEHEVAQAVRSLTLLGWLEVVPSPQLLPEDELLDV
jgi:hypothetical protein